MSKKNKNDIESLISEEQQKKLQDLANEMINIASNLISEYEDEDGELDIIGADSLSGSLEKLNQITQIHEDSPFLNEILEGDSWKNVIKNIPAKPIFPKKDKNDTE